MGGQLGKVDGAWPVLPSVCMDDDEPKTVPVSKISDPPPSCVQGVYPGWSRDIQGCHSDQCFCGRRVDASILTPVPILQVCQCMEEEFRAMY